MRDFIYIYIITLIGNFFKSNIIKKKEIRLFKILKKFLTSTYKSSKFKFLIIKTK